MGERETVPEDVLHLILFLPPQSPWDWGARVAGCAAPGSVILAAEGSSESYKLDLRTACTLGKCNVDNSNVGN